MAKPIPEEAPVIKTTFDINLFKGGQR
jgi:hypothetical protein